MANYNYFSRIYTWPKCNSLLTIYHENDEYIRLLFKKKYVYIIYNVSNLCIRVINVIILQRTLSSYEEQVAEIAIYKLYYKDIL